ncbi:Tetratricopeptide-like helical [Penicillium brevicompactum]|uniref:Tetratricopeptide-like helical n=1 Tax=Penicillium brevicompactum TaxID=5074 RepID=A0A9W9UIR6_PENBR|nr:Tetratricopeptide-like helical [Penicillium brevicompactum]
MLHHHASDDIAVGKISEDLQHHKVKLESKISSLRSALRGSVDSNDYTDFLDSANAVASLVRLNKHFYMPQSVSSYYTGRQKQLEQLKHTLGVSKSRERQDHQRRFVIHGLGGSGKTQFCSKFAQDNREHFWGIFWIDGSSYENAKHSYAEIGKVGGVEPNEKAAKNWLSSLQQPWLLLIDNADDPEVDVTQFFPGVKVGSGFFHFESLEVEEASDLLLAAAVFPRPWEVATREYARKAAQILGYLPLALIHAGKAVLERLCSLSEYPDYYQRTWDRIRRSRSRSNSRGHEIEHMSDMSVYSSYEMIYLGLESKDDFESKDALELLKIFSFFHWENIEFDFIKNAALNPRREQEDRRAKQRAEKPRAIHKRPKTWNMVFREWAGTIIEPLTRPILVLPAVLRDEDDQPFYEYRLRGALSLLERLGMLTSHAENDSYWMHPLVHTWVRQRPDTSTAEQALWCQAAATVLTQSIFFKPPDAYANQDQYLKRQIYPHVENVRKFQKELNTRFEENLRHRSWPWSMTWLAPRASFGRLQASEAAKFSLVYLECGYWSKAEELQLQVKDFVFAQMGPESEPGIAIALLLSNVYAIQTRHPATLNIMGTLGATCNMGSRLREANQLHQEVIDTLSAMEGIGPNHESTWTAVENLAKVKLRYLDHEAAIHLQSSAYQGFLNLLGPKHLKTLNARLDLADVAGFAGEEHLEPSLKMIEELEYDFTKMLGREHMLTLRAKLTMAKIKIALNRFEEAEELFRDGLPAAERNLGG